MEDFRGAIPGGEDGSVEATPEPLTPDVDAAVAFLEWLRPGGPWVLTAIPVEGGRTTTETFTSSELKRLRKWICDRNAKLNLYFMVNPARTALRSKAKKEDVEAVEFLHVDVDPRKGHELGPERARALAALEKCTPSPSAIIDSGGGYQGFWRLDEPLFVGGDLGRAAEAERYNIQLERELGGDSCHNVDRIMRLPGTINLPNDKKRKAGRKEALARVFRLGSEKYTLGEFTPAKAEERAASATAPVQLSKPPPPLKNLDELPEEVSPRTRMLIVQGDDPDDPTKYGSRSEVVFAVCCEMVRAGCDDETIAAVILDPDFAISAHVLAQRRSVEYAARQIERAREEVAEPMLRKMNELHFAVSSIGGKFRVASWRRSEIDDNRRVLEYQTVDDFRNRYMHRKVQVGTTKEGNPVYAPAGKWWLEHPMRRQFESVVFRPNEEVDELEEFNLWTGLALEPLPGEWPLLRQLLEDALAAGEAEHAEYILKWLAYAVQHPQRPAEVALVFRGGRGVGKSTLGNVMRRLFGQHGMSVTHSKHLHGQFNDHLHDCCFLFADEAVAPGDVQARQVIKTLITEPTMLVEPKGLGKFTARNRLHIIMASNETWVADAGPDERRFAVFDVAPCFAIRPGAVDEAEKTKWWRELYAELDSGGLEAFLDHLLSLDLGDWHPRYNVPQTEALRDQKARSLTPEEDWLLAVAESGIIPGGWSETRDDPFRRVRPSNGEDGLYQQMRDATPELRGRSDRKLGDFLSKWGFKNHRHQGRSSWRGWLFPALPELRSRWTERFGAWPFDQAPRWANEVSGDERQVGMELKNGGCHQNEPY